MPLRKNGQAATSLVRPKTLMRPALRSLRS